jgi:hypothetical protein
VNAPKLTCKSASELKRIVDWLVLSGIPCTWTQSELTVSLGASDFVEAPGWSATPLSYLKAANSMFWALLKLCPLTHMETCAGLNFIAGTKERESACTCGATQARIAIASARGEA